MRPVKGPLSHDDQLAEEDDCTNENKDIVFEPTNIDSTAFEISRPSNSFLNKL